MKTVCAVLSYRVSTNVIHALSMGALTALEIVGGIVSNLVAFMATLKFINATFAWFTARLCVNFTLSFEAFALSTLYIHKR